MKFLKREPNNLIMNNNENIVTLQKKNNPSMSPKSPVFIPIKELFEKYPTLEERQWSAEFFLILVENDVISGRFEAGKSHTLEIEQSSLEHFIDYHNSFLRNRFRKVNDNLDELNKKKV